MSRSRSFAVLLVAVLLVGPTLLALSGPDDAPSSPGPTAASPLPRVEGMVMAHEGDPSDPATYSAIAGLLPFGDGFSPAVGGSGHVVSVNYTLHEGKRWDYAVAIVDVPEGRVTLEVRDVANSSFPDDPVLATSVAAPGGDSVSIDLRTFDSREHVQLQLAVVLDHTGRTGQPPSVRSWYMGESDPDLWHDPFLDIGRDDSRGDLIITGGACHPINTHKPGGLLGDYYDDRGFTSFTFQRLDQTIDFDWGASGPGGGMGRNTFSIRWEGKLMVPTEDTYDIYLTVDDGGRLWIDGNLVIDEWRDQSPTEFTANLLLEAGLHDIRLDYYEDTGGAQCELRWSSSTITKRLVPHTALWGRETTNVLVSEDVQLPDGHVWDLLFVETLGGSSPIRYDLFDAHNDVPIPGYQCLTAPLLDLSKVSAGIYPRLQLRARWSTGDPVEAPTLTMWGVKWMPARTWRNEFLTDLKLVGTVGLVRRDGYMAREGTDTQTSLYAFAESFDGRSHLLDSTVRKGEYWQAGIPTVNATDVAVGDLDGDGLDDVLYSHGEVGREATGHRATAGGFKTAPEWTFPLPTVLGSSGFYSQVALEDLDGDGDEDVILVAHDTTALTADPDRIAFYWNGGSSFNDTPDRLVTMGGKPVVSISTGDIDDDGLGDIAVGLGGDGGLAGVLYGADGWASITDVRWSGSPVLAVHVGNLNGDRFDDLFVGANRTRLPADNNGVFYGSASGIGTDPSATFTTAPSFAATYADWNGDSQRDVVLATEDFIRVYLGGGTGFTAGPALNRPGVVDVTTIRAGGDADEDIAFAGADPVQYDTSGYMEAIGATGVFTRLLHTNNATAVASGSHFSDGMGSLRTAVIDLGEGGDVGHWDSLSYRMLPGQAGFRVTLNVRDADTEELLDTRTGLLTSASFDISAISMDEHPKVFIEALIENDNGFVEVGLAHLEVNWTARLPEPPRTLSIGAEEDTIYRTNGTNLRIQVADERDRPQFMKLTVQVRPPGGGGWISDRLGDPVWADGNWTVPFHTTRDDPTGVYGFRAWVTDSDMLSSDPLEVLDLVTVVNNPPDEPGIGIVPEAPLTDQELTVSILRQAYDRDTSYMDYEYRWFRDGSEVAELTGNAVPPDMTLKGQTWRVQVRAFDGEDRGPWVEAEVTIGNSPPRLLRPLGPIELLEDDPPVVLRVRDLFTDPDGDPLQVEASGAEAVAVVVDMDAGTITVSLPADWYGTDRATLNVSDGDLVLQEVLEVTAEPVRDPPRVVSIGGEGPVEGRFLLIATQGITSVFLVVVEDNDSDRFRFRSDANLASFELVTGNGTIVLTPTNGEVGLRTFNLSVEDWEGNSVVVPVDIAVANVNDPPTLVQIVQPKNGMTFEHDASILLRGTAEDPDERHGQVLSFTWLSSIDGELDRGMNVQVSGLSPGDHMITLEVSDGQYVSDKSIQIRVKEPPKDPDNGGPDDPGDDDPRLPGGPEGGLLWLVLVLALVALVALLVLYRRRRSLADTRGAGAAEDTEEETPPRMVEGIPVTMLGDGVVRGGEAHGGTDLLSVVTGRTARRSAPEEDIPSSPWSAEDLDFSARPMPVAPPPPPPAARAVPPPPPPPPHPEAPRASFDPSEWEESVDGEHVVTTPPPPPPPPRTGSAPPRPPTPPPPGIPSASAPPKRPVIDEEDWEEVD